MPLQTLQTWVISKAGVGRSLTHESKYHLGKSDQRTWVLYCRGEAKDVRLFCFVFFPWDGGTYNVGNIQYIRILYFKDVGQPPMMNAVLIK